MSGTYGNTVGSACAFQSSMVWEATTVRHRALRLREEFRNAPPLVTGELDVTSNVKGILLTR